MVAEEDPDQEVCIITWECHHMEICHLAAMLDIGHRWDLVDRWVLEDLAVWAWEDRWVVQWGIWEEWAAVWVEAHCSLPT